MRVALVAASTAQPRRGNFTTIKRWLSHRYDDGTELIRVAPDPDRHLDFEPDLVHGYHALHGGVAAMRLARRLGKPLLISLGGTDLHRLMEGREGAGEIEEVMRAADCLSGAFPGFRRLVLDRIGPKPYVAVPRSIRFREIPRPARREGVLSVLLPAGLRRVKDPWMGVDLAEKLVERGLPLQLTVMGPVIDEEYAASLKARAARLDFVRFEVRPPDRVAGAYLESDVCWNTSRREGGANALLEGLAYGCAVYARDVLGNRDFFEGPDAPATLFDPDDLEGAERFHRAVLAETPEDRVARVARARAWLRENHAPEREARALQRAWRSALTGS